MSNQQEIGCLMPATVCRLHFQLFSSTSREHKLSEAGAAATGRQRQRQRRRTDIVSVESVWLIDKLSYLGLLQFCSWKLQVVRIIISRSTSSVGRTIARSTANAYTLSLIHI